MTRLYKYGIAVLLLLPFFGEAQPRVQTRLEKPAADSFYRILLTPQLLAWCRPGASDLRIWNENNEPVPYILDTLKGISTFSWLRYPIISVKNDSAASAIEFAVPEESSAGFELTVGNTGVSRIASVSGSNDRFHWYSLQENMSLSPEQRDHSVEGMVRINYPLTRYRYIRILVQNKGHEPLEPLQAGRLMGEPLPVIWERTSQAVVSKRKKRK